MKSTIYEKKISKCFDVYMCDPKQKCDKTQ